MDIEVDHVDVVTFWVSATEQCADIRDITVDAELDNVGYLAIAYRWGDHAEAGDLVERPCAVGESIGRPRRIGPSCILGITLDLPTMADQPVGCVG